jgi:hypothetical protein
MQQKKRGGLKDRRGNRLDIFLYRNTLKDMAPATTRSHAFNAVAEPRRRDILNYLVLQERSVTEMVDAMQIGQPSVSKHRQVLRDVALVEARREGRQMLHNVNAIAIRPLDQSTSTFEAKHTMRRKP